jgi:hypothetical protein
MIERRKRITLTGSTRFRRAFEEWNARFTLQGYIVHSVAVYKEDVPLSIEQRRVLDEVYLDKIRDSDELFVLDVSGYVGEGTKREIAFALGLGKPVHYLSKECPDWDRILL